MEKTERYEAIDLALRAYRRVQDGGVLRRGVVLVGLNVVLMLIGGVVFWMARDGIIAEAKQAIVFAEELDMEAFVALWLRTGLVILAMQIPFWILYAAIEAANLRWYLRREETAGFLGIRLDADTLRVIIAQLLVWLVLFALWLGLPGLWVGLAFMAQGNTAVSILAVILFILTFFFNFVAVPYLAVRLAPTAALAVADGAVSLPRAWSGMRGRMLQPFLAFVLLFVVSFAVSQVLTVVLQFGMMGPLLSIATAAQTAGTSDPTVVFESLLEVLWSPGVVVAISLLGLLTIAVGYIFNIGMQAVCAGAVRDMRQASTDA
jgi:hypothetical protein